MIEVATQEDLDSVYRLALKFHRESQFPVALDEEVTYQFVSNALHPDTDIRVFVIRYEGEVVGLCAGVVTPLPFSKELVATELMWYVEPEFRGTPSSIKLMKAFEDWAKESGCAVCVMAYLETSTNVSNIYKRLGYRPQEHSFIKEL